MSQPKGRSGQWFFLALGIVFLANGILCLAPALRAGLPFKPVFEHDGPGLAIASLAFAAYCAWRFSRLKRAHR
jgi:hypothetical protein